MKHLAGGEGARVEARVVRATGALVAVGLWSAAAPARAEGDRAPSSAVAPHDEARPSVHGDDERAARQSLEARVAELERERRERATRDAHHVELSGYVHVDWVALRQSSQDELTQEGVPLNENRFLLRRARLRAERDHGLVHGALEIDANTVAGPQLRPINAEASLKWPASRPYARFPVASNPTAPGNGAAAWDRGLDHASHADSASDGPWLMTTAGLFRTPFGFEAQEGARQRPWLERSTMTSALFPQSFDLGLRFAGGFSFARYELGIMNGDPIGERTFPGRDPDKSKDLVFRVGGASKAARPIRVEGGVSAVTGRGFSKGQPATKDVLQWQDSNDDGVVDATELEISAGAPATPSRGFKRFAVGADLRVFVAIPVLGELALRGEIVRAQNLDRGLMVSDPVAATRDLRQLGWYVGVSQELTRWSLVAVRHDRYNADADAREQTPFAITPRDPTMTTTSFTVAARARLARLMAQYDHRTNALGRDASGAPAKLADDSLTLRGEVQF